MKDLPHLGGVERDAGAVGRLHDVFLARRLITVDEFARHRPPLVNTNTSARAAEPWTESKGEESGSQGKSRFHADSTLH